MKHTGFFRLLALVAILMSISAGAQTFQVLHAFDLPTDGPPGGPFMLDSQGNIFFASGFGGGTTDCGTYGCGGAFELSKGYGRWKETTLFSFAAVNGNSASPAGTLSRDLSGNIYGTLVSGGDPACYCGAVYQLTQDASGWSESLLHNFVGGSSDGMYPTSGLVMDAAGNLYGSTGGGGINGNGTIFELTPNADGTWRYGVVYYFSYGSGSSDGSIPSGPLTMDALGNIYGTTISGGLWSEGTAFRLSPSNGTWTETILFNFTLDYGATPQPSGVVPDAAGNLYGTTATGGAYNLGTIYKLTPAHGFWNRTVLYTFTGNDDGGYAIGGLAIDATGALYGESLEGGGFGYGNVYKFARAKGQWKQTRLHQFTNGNDGGRPINGVVLDWRGNVYGSTDNGGTFGYGTAFEITP